MYSKYEKKHSNIPFIILVIVRMKAAYVIINQC